MAGRIAGAVLITLFVAASAQAQTKAIRFGKLWDGSKTITDAVVVIDGDRIIASGRGNAAVPEGARGRRPAALQRHSRPDRPPHAHDLLLGSRAGHAPARAAPRAPRGHGLSRAGQRETDARDRRHDGARSGRRQRHGSGDARSDRPQRDGRSAHVRVRAGLLGARRRARRSGGLEEERRRARRRGRGLDQGLRLDRRLRERRHDADAQLRRDEDDRRRRARRGQEGGDSLVRRAAA